MKLWRHAATLHERKSIITKFYSSGMVDESSQGSDVADALLDARNEGAGGECLEEKPHVRYRYDLEILGRGEFKWKIERAVCVCMR